MSEEKFITCGSDQDNFISTPTPTPFPSSNSNDFSISRNDLTQIVTEYIERDANFNDLKYFSEHNGTDGLLNLLNTDKTNGIFSTENREEYFGSNKVFRKRPPNFFKFFYEALKIK